MNIGKKNISKRKHKEKVKQSNKGNEFVILTPLQHLKAIDNVVHVRPETKDNP